MRTRRRLAALALALLVASSGCFGSFAVTRSVYRANDHVEGQAAREGVFLALVIVPVYEAALLVDLLVFNTIELFGGHNPLDDSSPDDDTHP
ncbi:MAG TPA: DUF3332 family protein [Planctomycetota bacterium]|nr:DUF3332 family protein [Planctomycetota bacterium]